VSDNARAITASVVGGILGAMAGYLFFTEQGRRLRRQIEPALDDFTRELNHLRGTIHKVAGVAGEGWNLLNEALGESGPQPPPRYPTPHQTSPF
jgi:gas vesicle protein